MDDAEITLETRLRAKLEQGEITKQEFDELYAKFERLGLLNTVPGSTASSSTSSLGSTTIKSGKVNGPVNINGRGVVDGNLECNSLSVAGSAKIRGELTVLGKSSISGELFVDGNARFMDKIAMSGSLEVEESMYTLTTTSLSGKTRIVGDLINDNKCLISGKFSSMNLKSTGKIRVDGQMNIGENVIAAEFDCRSGKVSIGGSLMAQNIEIFSQMIQDDNDPEPGETILDLVSNVVNVVFPALMKSVRGILDTNPKVFSIGGNLEGKIISISNCSVNGDIVGDEIYIGPNVTVGGKIKYRNAVETFSEHNYNTEKIE